MITWHGRNARTPLDYVLANKNFEEKIQWMEIDEEGTNSLGSDHNRIKLEITFMIKPLKIAVVERNKGRKVWDTNYTIGLKN